MAVDLSDLVEVLKREVSVPGGEESTFPNADDSSWLGHIQDAFWDVRLDGMIPGYQESDGIVTPIDTSDDDLSRDLQQLVVLYAGIRIVRNQLRQIQTQFRAKAGPVEYETQQSATLLKDILAELHKRRAVVLERLSDLGSVEDYYIDAIAQRDYALGYGDTSWPGFGG